MRQRVAEQDSGGLVLDVDIDPYAPPLTLQHLLDQFAGAVTGGRHQLEGQSLSLGVAPDLAASLAPPRCVQQTFGADRIGPIARHVLRVPRVARGDEGSGHGLSWIKALSTDRFALKPG